MSLPRCIYDPNEPQQSMSLANLRNTLRGLFQGDLMPLRAKTSMILDAMEYVTDALAQANWSGTGVTVTKTTTKQEGNYALQCVIDATGNRKISKIQSLDLSAFKRIKLWERCSVESSEIQFYLKDSDGNESYWDIITNEVADTWQQDDLDLTTPDSNNGDDADLSDIVEWGFLGLDADETYIFDTVRAICGLNVAVEGGLLANFYQQAYIGQNRITFIGGSSPAITPPNANPRIDLLVLNSSNALEWVQGTEASTPSEPTFPTDKIPICLVYCKIGMAKVVDYEDKDANPDEGYIYKDVRPLLASGSTPEILSGLDADKSAVYVKDRFYWATDTNKLYWDNGSAWIDITASFAGFVRLTGEQTIAGVKTFLSFLVTPSSAPTTDYQVANKKYVDDNVGISPSHNGVIKAWASITYAAGVPTLQNSYNVAGIVDNGVGLITITWDTDFASVNYVPVANAGHPDTATRSPQITAIAVGSTSFGVLNESGDEMDPDNGFYVMAIGDQ